jgi:hypothetical protein
VVPFGVDALVIYLASTYGEVFWIFPVIVTMGSLAGNALRTGSGTVRVMRVCRGFRHRGSSTA